MIFEIGKFYRHTTGRELHVMGRVPSALQEKGSLVAECLTGDLLFVGEDEPSTVNYVECEPWVVKDHGVHSSSSV